LGAAIAAWSCGGSTISDQGTGGVAAVVVTPTAFTLSVGQTQPVQAAVQDADGQPVTGAAVVWSVKDGKIAGVSQTGLVTALAVGATEVAASSNGKSGLRVIRAIPRTFGGTNPKLPARATEKGVTELEKPSSDTPFLARN